jgi:hypothetical protein
MSEPSSLRASDADRERVASELRDHYAEGRLDADELSGRLDAVYASRTTAELDGLKTDLPALPVSPVQRRAELVARRAELRRHLIQRTGAATVPFLICTAIWASNGAESNFWPAFALIFPLIFLVRNGWALYGPAPDLERVEAELRHGGGLGPRGRHRGPYRGPYGPGPRHRHRHRRATIAPPPRNDHPNGGPTR